MKILKPVMLVFMVSFYLVGCAKSVSSQKSIPSLHAEGKWLVNDRGDKITLRGANIWSYRGPETSDSIEDIRRNIDVLTDKESGLDYANFVRLAVHSINICDESAMKITWTPT